jgi:hypothetical protein
VRKYSIGNTNNEGSESNTRQGTKQQQLMTTAIQGKRSREDYITTKLVHQH